MPGCLHTYMTACRLQKWVVHGTTVELLKIECTLLTTYLGILHVVFSVFLT